ncbi:NAD-dependent nucleoside diphosphate-sugar epimerase/dehydratase [Citrifermentans bemidjiense Bem]|uniref:NAD-dependent nucleoside diphosphate-sugar epimerase/dehydratase n=1 Tax=Citrifermentans bemidjiense (strain ATCC BAA-1014 / DSM 16622 / JCM 12645 / Bem) TaxID=404380 RepID=B5E9A9_CITBB|nr:nucleoside-diphosphate sugar epimerase/dehydratase [Citrifermentans bemidjiense]ACH38651.1 NAD-dependent nucleoside diphosphate-sugar epimerase/dehydratase [Citrifermentans bemidjiense Bem]
MFRTRRFLVFFLDVALIVAAFTLAFLLRFDLQIPADQSSPLLQGLVIVLAVKSVIFIASGMYRCIWRYASLRDAYEIFKVVTLSSVVSALALLLIKGPFALPRSIYFLDWFLLFSLVAGSRLVWRVYRETRFFPSLHKGKKTLIIGAGEAGNLLLKEIRKEADSPYNVIGFVDDDIEKRGMRLSGVRVLGGTNRLCAMVRKHAIEEVIFAIPSGDGELMRRVIANCKRSKARFKTLPGITAIVDGKVSMSQIKDVEIEDLLGRDPVMLDQTAIRNYLTDKRVLVTGAAGSIGSEICRQVARFKPAKLVLFDHAETPLFYIEKELAAAFPDLRIIPMVGDVKNQERVEAVFDEFIPEVVFHAAAYKHVAMMEYNPAEAVLNNVLGSRIVADAAHKTKVSNFVMVSTDKAVNPTNVMGATKRSAEIYVQALAAKSQTKFTTVRFGNVLGSNGSVIPLFKEQIRKGGPVTVTHSDVVRYFMTIPEASQLVMQAGCIGRGGEIFVLDMGEPVRILSLAEELIRLSGLIPYKEMDIQFTGLKPGEKLFEELLINGEGIKPTSHKKIRVMAPVETDLRRVSQDLDELFGHARNQDIKELLKSLRRMVPEFVPRYEFDVAPPFAFQRVRPDLFPPQKLTLVRNLQLASKEGSAA